MSLLRLDLQYFAEGDADPSAETKNTDTEADPNGEGTKQPEEIMIPKSRFDEVNNKYRDSQKQLEEFQAAKLTAERKAQEESGEFKTLYESTSKEYADFKAEIEAVQERNKNLEGVVAGLLDAKLQDIPEDFHDLIPSNLTPESKLEWISKAESKGLFGKAAQQPVGGQTNGSSQTGITKEQFLKMGYSERAQLLTTSPDLYRKLSV